MSRMMDSVLGVSGSWRGTAAMKANEDDFIRLGR